MTVPLDAPAAGPAGRPLGALSDGWTIMRRDLAHLRYAPTELAGQLAFPAVMVVLFGYIFGSAITVPGGNYREYLIPGLFAFSQITAAGQTALATTDDAARGVMDRLRSMPIARWAVPFGRVGAEVATSVLNLAVLAGCGLVVGWRPHRGVTDTVLAFALLLFMCYALSWVGVYLGLLIRNPGTADALIPLSFPVAMLSNGFVPTTGMPAWLRAISDYNPVSCLVQATRHLFGNPTTPPTAWPLQHPIIATLAWTTLLIATITPLATHRYRTAHL
jgi:ABC-2 type transport system permease protein